MAAAARAAPGPAILAARPGGAGAARGCPRSGAGRGGSDTRKQRRRGEQRAGPPRREAIPLFRGGFGENERPPTPAQPGLREDSDPAGVSPLACVRR